MNSENNHRFPAPHSSENSSYNQEYLLNDYENPVSPANLFPPHRTSNLTPTAAEFVPRRYDNGGHNKSYAGRNASVNNHHYHNYSSTYNGKTPIRQEQNLGAIRKHTRDRNLNVNSHYLPEPSTSNYQPSNDYRMQNNNYDRRYDNFAKSDTKFYKNNNNKQQNFRGKFRMPQNKKSYNNYDTNHSYHYSQSPHQQHQSQSRNLRVDRSVEANIISKCSQREKLIREIDSSKLECLVCCDNVKPTQAIWSCPNCYHILHLNCISKWATSSKSEDGWRCPACQNITKNIPRDYYCFCNRVKNPQYNRNDVAHSCGELCGRGNVCDHPCTLLCHPGPCPPCQASVERYCGCGSTKKTLQCCQKEEIVCDSECGKILNCNIHKCTEKCHSGECKACEIQIAQECFCTKKTIQSACTDDNRLNNKFTCGEICNKQLSCGNHNCAAICHTGECGVCPLSPDLITSCPCGKQIIVKEERKSCLEAIQLCKSVCGKVLPCGKPGAHHTCVSRCHLKECPPCNKITTVKCRCGHMDQQVKCKTLKTRCDDARCKKRCSKLRSCAKHKCNQECCIEIDHICPLPCSQTLSCGKHKCDQTCHKGRCKPCHRTSFDELACNCGANVIFPPVPCGTKKPICDKPCPREHTCHHQVLHNCHSEVKCPPCVVLTTKYCFGKHEQRKTIPCYQESFSCGLSCNKSISCGRHKCIRPCHEDECQKNDEICKQNCTKQRNECSHPCNAQCHEGDDCPDLPCKENVEVTCECGNRKQTRTCHDFSKDFRRIASAQLASSMLEMQRGGSVELSDILGSAKIKNNKTLDCNEECRLLERNRRLAIGLQIRNPDTSSKLHPNYSEFLKSWAKKDPQLVKSIHEKLTELVKLAKESKQKSRSYSFPTMNRDKRHLVHEMCEMFGVESIAYDAEPNRNVVAIAERSSSWLPSMSIMEVLQRENGQRRIVVPSLNAWGRTGKN